MRHQPIQEDESSDSKAVAQSLEPSVIILGVVYFAVLLALIVRLLP